MVEPLLSLLNDLERGVAERNTVSGGSGWDVNLAVNHQHLVARLSLTSRGADSFQRRGVIFLQSAVLADGSPGFKVSFNWRGSDAFPVLFISHPTRGMNWETQASRIIDYWLAGPPSTRHPTTVEFAPLIALAS
jgi:hypothetical protein